MTDASTETFTEERIIDRIDPVYRFVKLVCHIFFRSDLVKWEWEFVVANVRKHRKILELLSELVA